jgi:putative ABC transport system ATP-binding protein
VTLTLHEVVKHYPAGGEIVRAADGITLCVERGEMVALCGPSGSGKTTLLMLAAALVRPDRGSVAFDGHDVGHMTEEEAADYRLEMVGLISQDYELMPGVPAVENAAVKLLAGSTSLTAARRRAKPWLGRVGLDHRLNASPEQLSGGERQRVAIARALLGRPAIVLADEPTGNLDTGRGRAVLELLRSISHEHGVAVLLVTHDPLAAKIADRTHTLCDGRLTDGSDWFFDAPDEATPASGP